MKKFKLLLLFFALVSLNAIQAQSIDELKAMKADKEAALAKEQGEADAIKAEVDALSDQILKLSGWQNSFSGLVGFSFNKSNNWVSSPNKDARSTSLNIGLNGAANKVTDSYFWNNRGFITKSWQDVDLTEADQDVDDDGLFDNGTVDILNLSSLYGRNLTEKFAISGLAELNTSLGNFLEPGTFDIGVGGTWLPIENMTVVIHPINYHVAFSGVDGVDSEGLLGAKIRADYSRGFGDVNWTSSLSTFIPYASKEPTLFEYTWLNTLAFNVWKGVGVGFTLGIRNAEFESVDTQTFYTLGLSYSL